MRAKRRMKRYPTRVPNPVMVTARAKRNAVKTSQTVTFENPESACAGVRIRVSASTVMAMRTLTPMRTGCATSATMVATKTISK